MSKINEEIMTEKEAAEFLTLSVKFLQQDRVWNGKKEIPYVKIGKLVRYRKCDLNAFVERSLITA